MKKLSLVAVLAFAGLVFASGEATAQSISVTPGAIIPPTPPNTNSTFPASGTYALAPGTTLTSVNCELGYYTANRNGGQTWTKVSSKSATAANNAFSVTFNEVNDPAHIYVMKVKLIVPGSPNGAAFDEQSY